MPHNAAVILAALGLGANPAAHAEPPAPRPAIHAVEVYFDAALGLERAADDAGLMGRRNLGRFALGLSRQLGTHSELYAEIEHMSDLQQSDTGINAIWAGVRLRLWTPR